MPVSEMKAGLIWVALLSMLTMGCVPSYERLKSYDTVKALHGGQIILVLDDRQDEAQTYAEYGFEKRAARLQRLDQKAWDMFSEGKKSFGFCPVELVWNSQFNPAGLADSSFVMTIERQTEYRGEHQEEVVCMVVRDASGNYPPQPFPGRQVIGTGLSQSGVSYAFSQLDKRMRQSYLQAVKLKESNTSN